MYRSGAFPFDRLVTFYDFADIEQAVANPGDGTIKAILRIGSVDG